MQTLSSSVYPTNGFRIIRLSRTDLIVRDNDDIIKTSQRERAGCPRVRIVAIFHLNQISTRVTDKSAWWEGGKELTPLSTGHLTRNYIIAPSSNPWLTHTHRHTAPNNSNIIFFSRFFPHKYWRRLTWNTQDRRHLLLLYV